MTDTVNDGWLVDVCCLLSIKMGVIGSLIQSDSLPYESMGFYREIIDGRKIQVREIIYPDQ